MTQDEATQIIQQLRLGAELSIRNHEGEWGLRAVSGGLELWERYPYESTEPRLVSDEEASDNLCPLDLEMVLTRLIP